MAEGGSDGPACVPGQRVCKKDPKAIVGKGVYERKGVIFASVCGFLTSTTTEEGHTLLEVHSNKQHALIPTVGDIVCCRVTQITQRFCKCAILSVNGAMITIPFRGMIRREDVRAMEKDKVEVAKSFRPCDIIIARVISLGDSQAYLLRTGENELGVVLAKSDISNQPMVPLSWCEMQCPATGTKEFRKVAKMKPEYAEFIVE